MFKKLLAVVVAAGFSLAFVADANATFWTEQATVDVASTTPASGPPIDNVITVFKSSGRLFTNTYHFGAGAQDDPADPLLIRTVGVMRLNSVTNKLGFDFTGITGPGDAGDPLVVIFALDGRLVDVASQTALFTSGGYAVFRDDGVFNSGDPTTWTIDVDSDGNFFNDAIYTGELKPPENIVQGTGASIAFAKSDVNRSAINTDIGNSSQGVFLFREVLDPGPGYDDGDGDTLAGEFIDVTTNGTGLPLDETEEGLATTVDQVVDTAVDLAALSAAERDALNLIALEVGGLSDLGAGEHFATFGSGDVLDWDPGSGAFVDAGDFTASLQGENHPGLQNFIPEPSSMTLLAIGSVCGLLFAGVRRRRRNSAAA